MANLQISDEQVIGLVQQLSPARQEALLRSLLSRRWAVWDQLSREGQDGARNAAARRQMNWDEMNEQQRQDFVDDLVHEGRACRR